MVLLIRLFLELLSIPGILVHELGHQVFCWLTGTRVEKVCYFRFSLPPGYVVHELPDHVFKHVLISGGPMLVNTGLALLAGVAAQRGWVTGLEPWLAKALLLWLGVAIGMHAFPSLDDANNVMDHIWQKGTGWFTRLLAMPPGILLYLGAFARWVWLDVAWGFLVVVWGPRFFMR